MATETSPRSQALRNLAEQYDHFAELEQELVGAGEYEAAEVAHDRALVVLAAYNAEDTNPPTQTPPCLVCSGVRWCSIEKHLSSRLGL